MTNSIIAGHNGTIPKSMRAKCVGEGEMAVDGQKGRTTTPHDNSAKNIRLRQNKIGT